MFDKMQPLGAVSWQQTGSAASGSLQLTAGLQGEPGTSEPTLAREATLTSEAVSQTSTASRY